MANKTAYLRDENLLTLFSLNNLIVPEIQREYVWGNNPQVIERFLDSLEKKASPCETCHHVHTNKNINVGFLYSYKPSYVQYESERILDEYLIDGQQRITTLFLLLLYRASVEGRMDDFEAIFRAGNGESEIGFNYKVRDLTQQFVLQLIRHARQYGKSAFDFVNNVSEDCPYWFLEDYREDPTVMSMIEALKSIKKIFKDDDKYYFDFLLTNIHFWHFKTEATSQGEELYITMNSRGEQLSDNEMKKARALPAEDQPKYGSIWENWQTFFWRKREGNPNADKGFNMFLENIEWFEWFHKMSNPEAMPKITSIEIYMDALKHITSATFKTKVEEEYKGLYTKWLDNYTNELWKQINTYDGSWKIIDPRGMGEEERSQYKNQSIARNMSMLFWPWMYYFKQFADDKTKINDLFLIRLLHFYYIRYNCYKRSSTSISTIVDKMMDTDYVINPDIDESDSEEEEDNGSSRIFSEEETIISELVSTLPEKRKIIESLIWEIQDLPYFIDGKGVGGNTIVDFIRKGSGVIDWEDIENSLQNFKRRINDIIATDNQTGNIVIKEILLFYNGQSGSFLKTQSPWYYTNYESSNWKRIVRTESFLAFYKEYGSFIAEKPNADFKGFLTKKRKEFFESLSNINRGTQAISHRELCIIYDFLTGNGLWDNNHWNISFWPNKESTDDIYIGQDSLWRGQRYYDGHSRVRLPENWREELKTSYKIDVTEPTPSEEEKQPNSAPNPVES